MVDAVIEELSLHWISTESIILFGLLFATAVAVFLRHFYRVALLNETRATSHFAVSMCLPALCFVCTLWLAEWLGDYSEVYNFCGDRRTACRVHFLPWQNLFW
jgi:purine-cytosine permease-like protein